MLNYFYCSLTQFSLHSLNQQFANDSKEFANSEKQFANYIKEFANENKETAKEVKQRKEFVKAKRAIYKLITIFHAATLCCQWLVGVANRLCPANKATEQNYKYTY